MMDICLCLFGNSVVQKVPGGPLESIALFRILDAPEHGLVKSLCVPPDLAHRGVGRRGKDRRTNFADNVEDGLMNEDIIRPPNSFIAEEVRIERGKAYSALVQPDRARGQDSILVYKLFLPIGTVRRDNPPRSIKNKMVTSVITKDRAHAKVSDGLNRTNDVVHFLVQTFNCITNAEVSNILELSIGVNTNSSPSRHAGWKIWSWFLSRQTCGLASGRRKGRDKGRSWLWL
mmetsp:Transcript_15050/g.31933  ORF Transcript_15050/g.31933 Transcript_15050/m.31933 type:complete len:231 (-) Transcript_15050:49-741(-)